MILTVQPLGGLANRMLAIASGIHLSRECNCDLEVAWNRLNELNAQYDKLFNPISGGIIFYPGPLKHAFCFSVPRKKNLFLPAIYQRIRYGFRLTDSPDIYRYLECPAMVRERLLEMKRINRDMYVASGYEFYDFPDSMYGDVFHPREEIMREIERRTAAFTIRTVGVHLRRTDHKLAIAQSPTEMFIRRMHELVTENDDTTFYLATDDEEDRRIILNEFGDRVFTTLRKADRTSLNGMRDAVADMYSLSRTSLILGSYGSTFNHTAARIGGSRLEVIRKTEP